MVYWGSNCYSQVTRLKIKDSISISGNRTYEILLNDHSLQDTNKLHPVWIIDGVPFLTSSVSCHNISPETIDSIRVQNDTLFSYTGRALYYRIIKIYSKKSINQGLKHILKKTNYWVYENPLTMFEINGIYLNNDTILLKKLFSTTRKDIKRISINKEERNSNLGYGVIRLKLK